MVLKAKSLSSKGNGIRDNGTTELRTRRCTRMCCSRFVTSGFPVLTSVI